MIRRIIAALVFTFASSTLLAESAADGMWDFTMSSQMGSVDASVTLLADGDKLTGEFDLGGGRKWLIEDGTISGNEISFNINRDGASMTYAMKAVVEGDSIKGNASAMGSIVEWSMARID